MLTIENKLNTTLQYPFFSDNLEDLIFFDIETTGFSADISSVYLIGAVYYKGNSFHSIQWFADDYDSEKELLTSFFTFIKNFRQIIHFNGTTFDMPYLLKKCKQHHLNFDFSQLSSIDIYKLLLPYKRYFPTNSMKLKVLEDFLNIHREDSYDGGQLIHIYGNFLKAKFSHSDEENQLLKILLLHNYEDIVNLLEASSVLFYVDWFTKKPIFKKIEQYEDTLIFHLRGPLWDDYPLLQRRKHTPFILAQRDDIIFKGNQTCATLQVPIYSGELKFFYENYKDYFYLPNEDTAIHKSVAVYVEKEYRQKAKKNNCYTRQCGQFLWQPNSQLSPALKESCSSKNYFYPFDETFLSNTQLIEEYIQLVMGVFSK